MLSGCLERTMIASLQHTIVRGDIILASAQILYNYAAHISLLVTITVSGIASQDLAFADKATDLIDRATPQLAN